MSLDIDSRDCRVGLHAVVLKCRDKQGKGYEEMEALSLKLPEDGPEVGAKLQTNKPVQNWCNNKYAQKNTHINTFILAEQTKASAGSSSGVHYVLHAAER